VSERLDAVTGESGVYLWASDLDVDGCHLGIADQRRREFSTVCNFAERIGPRSET